MALALKSKLRDSKSEKNLDRFVQLPYMSRLAEECREGGWCKWYLVVDGVPVPWDVMYGLGIVAEVGNKKYIPRELADKLRLYVFDNVGSARNPVYILKKVLDINGNVLETHSGEEAKELGEKYIKQYYALWKKALERVSPPTIVFKEPKTLVMKEYSDIIYDLKNDYLVIRLKKTPRYTVINVLGVKAKSAKPILDKIVEEVAKKHGFKEGKYGGYITYGKVSDEEIKNILDEIKQKIMEHKDELVKYLEEVEKLEYMNKKKEIEEARKKLGIYKPAEEPVTREDILRLAGITGAEEAKPEELEKTEEIPDIEEVLEEFGILGTPKLKPAVQKEERPEAGKKTEAVEVPREVGEVRVPELSEEEIKRIIMKQGLVPVKLVTFKLPTEYRGAETVYSKEGERVVEKKIFKVDPRIFRSLRREFYDVLNKIAYRTTMGWVILGNPDPKYLNKLNEIITKFNKLGSTPIRILEVYVPKEPLIEWLRENIMEEKMNIEKIKEKLATEQLKKSMLHKYQKKLNELIEYVQNLEDELKKLMREM